MTQQNALQSQMETTFSSGFDLSSDFDCSVQEDPEEKEPFDKTTETDKSTLETETEEATFEEDRTIKTDSSEAIEPPSNVDEIASESLDAIVDEWSDANANENENDNNDNVINQTANQSTEKWNDERPNSEVVPEEDDGSALFSRFDSGAAALTPGLSGFDDEMAFIPVESFPLITEVPKAIHEPLGQGYSHEELGRMFEGIRDKLVVPPAPARVPLREWMGQEIIKAVAERNYEYGARLKEADAFVASKMKSDAAAFLRDKRQTERSDRLSAVNERLKDIDEDCCCTIEQWHHHQALRADELVHSQKEALIELEQRWSDPESLRRFRKPSRHLLVLRTTERRLAVMRLFERAKRIGAEADRVEREESAEAERRALAAMRTEYENLADTQHRRMDCFEEWVTRHRQTNDKHRTAKVEPIQVTLTRLSTNTPVLPKRNKIGVWPTYAWPESPRRVKDAQNTNPGEPLALSGIRLREHIRIKKVNIRSSCPQKNQKQNQKHKQKQNQNQQP